MWSANNIKIFVSISYYPFLRYAFCCRLVLINMPVRSPCVKRECVLFFVVVTFLPTTATIIERACINVAELRGETQVLAAAHKRPFLRPCPKKAFQEKGKIYMYTHFVYFTQAVMLHLCTHASLARQKLIIFKLRLSLTTHM